MNVSEAKSAEHSVQVWTVCGDAENICVTVCGDDPQVRYPLQELRVLREWLSVGRVSTDFLFCHSLKQKVGGHKQ